MTPSPTTSAKPRMERLDCRRRTRCLGLVVDRVHYSCDADAPYLDCRDCPAYQPVDADQRASDVVVLNAVGLAAMKGWRRVAMSRGDE